MNKKKATDIVWQGITAKELRDILEDGFESCDPESISSLNKGMTKAQAYEIFRGMLDTVPEETIYGPKHDVGKNRDTISGAMGAVNILREFG